MISLQGEVVCILAAGPSLNPEDCELVEHSGHLTICVGNSWKIAKFCDFVFAADFKYWQNYIKSVDVDAEFWSCSRRACEQYELNYFDRTVFSCSGACAIAFAIAKGAKKIVLVGFDNSVKNGIHFDGLHEGSASVMSNPSNKDCERWQKDFLRLSLMHSQIVNCSRHTEIKAFKLGKLEEELC